MEKLSGFTASNLLKALSLAIVLYLSVCCTPVHGKIYNIVCFYNNSAQHRPDEYSFNVSHIDPSLCTHLVFGFAQLDGNKVIATEDNDDLPDGMWRQFNDLKQNAPVKTLLGVGGSRHGTERFVTMASERTNRTEFIFELIFLLREWNFDGVHIEWEDPGMAEKDLFTSLIQELSATFEREAAIYNLPKLLLAISVPAFNTTMDEGYDIPALDGSVDMYFVKAFDYHGPWENVTGLIADVDDVKDTLNNYLVRSATSEKLHVVFPFFGRTFTLEDPTNRRVPAPASGPGTPLRYTQEPGLMAVFEMCFMSTSLDSWHVDAYSVTIFYRGDQWVSWSFLAGDGQKLQEFLDYFDSSNFGGVAVWTLDYDNFAGNSCSTYLLTEMVFVIFHEREPAKTTTTTSTTTTTTEATTATTTPTTTTTETTTTMTTPTTTTTTEATATTTTLTTTTTTEETTTATIPTTTTTTEATTTATTPTTTTTTEATTTTTTPTTTMTTATTTLQQGPFSVCPTTEVARYPHRDSCTKYIYCMAGMPFALSCPPDQIFNPDIRACEDSATTTYICKLS